MEKSKAVLITGCSSGIGEATARLLAERGWTVYATARNPDRLEPLAAAGCRTLALDVTDEHSMSTAVATVERDEGAVGVLINNAGYSQSGAIEQVPLDEVRREFETNVFGLVRMCQLVLPGMRRQRYGRIVNLSSMGGRLVLPGGGFYHATKYAVEAISDALRFEVRGFGVDVVIVEPGLIKTRFGETAAGSVDSATVSDGGAGDAYASFNETVAKMTRETYESGPLSHFAGSPEVVARTIAKAIDARRPRTRYVITASARLMLAQRRIMSDRLWDRAMATQIPPPR